MARARQTKASLRRLYSQFIQYGIKEPIGYEEYTKIVDVQPITRRELANLFQGRWQRVLKVLGKYYPDVYQKAAEAHKTVEKPAAKPKVAPKPKAKPVVEKKDEEDSE